MGKRSAHVQFGNDNSSDGCDEPVTMSSQDVLSEAKPTSVAKARARVRDAWIRRFDDFFDPGGMIVPLNKEKTLVLTGTEMCIATGALQYNKRQRKTERKKSKQDGR